MPTINPAMTEERFAHGVLYNYNGIAMSANEDGDCVFAYGDLDDQVLADAVRAFFIDVVGEANSPTVVLPGDVLHRRAVDVSDDNNWAVSWADEYQDHPESFPITLCVTWVTPIEEVKAYAKF